MITALPGDVFCHPTVISKEDQTRMKLNKLTLTILAGVLGACGDSGSTSQGPSKIGISDPDSIVSELNAAEWEAACQDLEETSESRDLHHGVCILGAQLLAAPFGLDCQESYDECLVEGGAVDCDELPTDCNVTLRELDECNSEFYGQLNESARDIDCSSSFKEAQSINLSVPPSCDALKERCPAFFDGVPGEG